MDELTLPQKVISLDHRLAENSIDHAFGGAIALAYYAEPRVTIDIDVNLFVEAGEYPRVLEVLGELGIEGRSSPADVARDGQTRTDWGRNPVDLFFAYDPFHEAMRKSARSVEFGRTRIPVLAPEHLLVCKAAFDRPKDWIDIEQMLIGVDTVDEVELWNWLERVLGPEDERIDRVEELWRSNR